MEIKFMENQYFTIKDYPNDIYNAVGQIIKASQEWEVKYKKLAVKLELPVKNIDNSSLNKLNDALKKHNIIIEKDYNNLKKVIEIRNYINHDFFIDKFDRNYDDYDLKIKEMQNFLNATMFLIYEATDVIDNKIDELNGSTIKRPTVFD